MLKASAKEKDVSRFVSEISAYNDYQITGETKHPYHLINLCKVIPIQIEYETDSAFTHTATLKVDVSKWPMRCTVADRVFGEIHTLRAYDKRKKTEDRRLENCTHIQWGQAGVVIECEKDTIVIIATTSIRYTIIDGKRYDIRSCVVCPFYVDYGNMCNHPETMYEGKMGESYRSNCPLKRD